MERRLLVIETWQSLSLIVNGTKCQIWGRSIYWAPIVICNVVTWAHFFIIGDWLSYGRHGFMGIRKLFSLDSFVPLQLPFCVVGSFGAACGGGQFPLLVLHFYAQTNWDYSPVVTYSELKAIRRSEIHREHLTGWLFCPRGHLSLVLHWLSICQSELRKAVKAINGLTKLNS